MWLALDYSEDEVNGQTEKLAVRFKHAETKDEFKKAFEDAQKQIGGNQTAARGITPIVDRARPARVY